MYELSTYKRLKKSHGKFTETLILFVSDPESFLLN